MVGKLLFRSLRSSFEHHFVDLSAENKNNIQGVHKVSLQFKKIIKKWNDEISQWGLFYVNQYFIKFLLTLKFIVSDKIS